MSHGRETATHRPRPGGGAHGFRCSHRRGRCPSTPVHIVPKPSGPRRPRPRRPRLCARPLGVPRRVLRQLPRHRRRPVHGAPHPRRRAGRARPVRVVRQRRPPPGQAYGIPALERRGRRPRRGPFAPHARVVFPKRQRRPAFRSEHGFKPLLHGHELLLAAARPRSSLRRRGPAGLRHPRRQLPAQLRPCMAARLRGEPAHGRPRLPAVLLHGRGTQEAVARACDGTQPSRRLLCLPHPGGHRLQALPRRHGPRHRHPRHG